MSCILIALSGTMALGSVDKEPLINNINSNTDALTENSSIDNPLLEDIPEDENEAMNAENARIAAEKFPETNSVSADAGNFFDIVWQDQDYGATSQTSHVIYGYEETVEGVTTFVEMPAWQVATVVKAKTNATSYTGQNLTRISHFDVRYYEETYTNSLGKWSYDGSYMILNGTKYPITKLACMQNSKTANPYWYYYDELSTATWNRVQTSAVPEIRMVFKKVPSDASLENTYDFKIDSKNDTTTNATANVQFCYCVEGDTNNLRKMDPPFSGDLTLTSNNSSTWSSGQYMLTNNFAGRAVMQDVGGEIKACGYRTAYISNDPNAPMEEWKEVSRIGYSRRNNNTGWYYAQPNSSTMTRLSNNTALYVRFVYDYTSTSMIPTVDGQSRGININVFDYDAFYAQQNSSRFEYGINYDYAESDFRRFAFSAQDQHHSGLDTNLNNFVGDGDHGGHARKSGLWSNKLGEDGYPQLASSYGGDSLAYLFDPSVKDTYKHSYTKLNGLFAKAYYDATGYFYYGSNSNTSGAYTTDGWFAQVRKKSDEAANSNEELNNQFLVYSSPRGTVEGANDDPMFMPFDDYNNPNIVNSDYFFGMTIDFNFIQPKDGQITEGGEAGPMVFNFNGDDDVYVYLDGVLALDLGGIHREIEGTINFAEGTVKYVEYDDDGNKTGAYNPIISLFDLYADAGVIDPDDETSWGQYFVNYGTEASPQYRFKDYGLHTFNFYYLERGAGASNCRIAFNIPTLPAGAILLGKDIKDEGTVAHVDGEFSYKVQVCEYDDDTNTYPGYEDPDTHEWVYEYSDYVCPVDEQGNPSPVKVYEGSTTAINYDKPVKDIVVNAADHGQISIKDGTVAILNGFNVKDKFKIVEFDPRETAESEESKVLDLLWNVFCNSIPVAAKNIFDIVYYDPVTSDTKTIKGYGTDELMVGYTGSDAIQFTNQVSENSLFDLVVDKDALDVGNVSQANVLVCFNGETDTEGRPVNPEPYVGDYWFVNDNNSHKEAEPRHTDGQPILLDNNTLLDRILIEDVQMETRATVYVVDDLEFKDVDFWHNEYVESVGFQAGDISLSYDGAFAGFYACRIPFVLTAASIPDADKYSEIDLSVCEEPNSLKFEKQITGMYADKTIPFELTPILYTSIDPELVPFNPGDDVIFGGYLYTNQTETTINITAKVNEKGELLINTDPFTGDTFEYPVMTNFDYILIREILSASNLITHINAFEEVNADFTPTFNQVTTGMRNIEMATPYSPLSATSGKDYVTMVAPIALDTETGNYVYVRNHDNDSPPTGLDIFKNPDLWMLILAVVVALLAVGPIKLIRVRQRRKKLFSADTEVFENEDILWEGLGW